MENQGVGQGQSQGQGNLYGQHERFRSHQNDPIDKLGLTPEQREKLTPQQLEYLRQLSTVPIDTEEFKNFRSCLNENFWTRSAPLAILFGSYNGYRLRGKATPWGFVSTLAFGYVGIILGRMSNYSRCRQRLIENREKMKQQQMDTTAFTDGNVDVAPISERFQNKRSAPAFPVQDEDKGWSWQEKQEPQMSSGDRYPTYSPSPPERKSSFFDQEEGSRPMKIGRKNKYGDDLE